MSQVLGESHSCFVQVSSPHFYVIQVWLKSKSPESLKSEVLDCTNWDEHSQSQVRTESQVSSPPELYVMSFVINLVQTSLKSSMVNHETLLLLLLFFVFKAKFKSSLKGILSQIRKVSNQSSPKKSIWSQVLSNQVKSSRSLISRREIRTSSWVQIQVEIQVQVMTWIWLKPKSQVCQSCLKVLLR